MVCLCLLPREGKSQDSTTLYIRINNFPDKLFRNIQNKTNKLEVQLSRQTEKYLTRLSKQELKLKKKLYRVDPNAANQLFPSDENFYIKLLDSFQKSSSHTSEITGEYLPNLDSLKGALAFVEQNPHLFSPYSKHMARSSLAQLRQFQLKMQQTEMIKQLIRERKDQLKQAGRKTGISIMAVRS